MRHVLPVTKTDGHPKSGAIDLPERELFVLGFQRWKRPFVRRFFKEKRLRFVSGPEQLPAVCTVLVWGMRYADVAFPCGVRVIRVEDGFIRSVGLGADIVKPLSWVLDDMSIYYDATKSSRLERVLLETAFTEAMLTRASMLRDALVSSGITKYNVGGASWLRPAAARAVILVPGQVETDASIRYGAPSPQCTIRRNMDLLRAVRQARPDAYIVYKPHPDVIAGLRLEGEGEECAARWCDEIVTEVPMGAMLEQVDEVHVLTSLAGFEALLRGKHVTCYGQPFYAGWGLTADIFPITRRVRRLALPELIAGVMLLYPMYVSRLDERAISAEECLEELVHWRGTASSRLPLWRRPLRWLLQRGKW